MVTSRRARAPGLGGAYGGEFHEGHCRVSVESRHIGVILGLTAFAVAVLCGLAVDNPMDVVLSRALASLAAGFFVGALLGGVLAHVIEAHVKRYIADRPVPTPNSSAHTDSPVQVVDEAKKDS